MSKRAADKQLTQLNQFDEDNDEDLPAPFRRAGDNDLAQRVIKKPKSRLRAQAQPAAAPAVTDSDSQPKSVFKGFSFGQAAANAPAASATPAKPAGSFVFGAGSTSGFVFGNKPDAAADKPAASPFKPSTGFSFGEAKPAGPAAPASGFGAVSFKPAAAQPAAGFSFGQAKPSASAEAPKEAAPQATASAGFSMSPFKPPTGDKPAPAFGQAAFGAFGSTSKPSAGFSMPSFKPPSGDAVAPAFGGAKPSNGFASSVMPSFAPPTTSASAPAKTGVDDSEEFYRNIRGLNMSLQTKIGDALKENAFVDLCPLLEQYRAHWSRIAESHPPPADAAKGTAMAVDKPAASSPSKDAAMSVDKPAAGSPSKSLFAPQPPPAKPLFPTTATSSMPKPAFGASAADADAPKSSGFSFGFGKPASAEETAKPFSFGFGNPAAAATAGTQQKSAFSFGFGKPAEQSEQQREQDGDGDAGSDGDEAEEAPVAKEPTNRGEEGETTVHQSRVKLFRWDKDENKYRDLGICNLRINVWGDDGARRARVVCRQDTTEKITLNASIFAQMTVEHTPDDKSVGLLVFMDGQAVQFRPRLKTSELARDLKAALDRVIATL
ncbi:hypothetical protein H4R21_000429 [Coemansia helicoidea]|uniref:Uncharacterized protein n=1 Tax=Coemansia helicoidea TaxID=1286919 RepID=A0ACC1LG41_9FUNG|nr:hypothetical protein H4R21_000429 [Coemansia helicoidea]